ncbi:39S ribosomal protein L53, mitochondrial [Trichinella pseudospiralis]|uniref:Large ribosomal subunit protein mL53 n=3 Tax=Trichinella pseudospiralis TaxID=6337 RepID=A0A0V1DVN2_TRIPS|nr:39S ribosomal protein L53, mitochondrial [Trichinella pseudospiralis]KRY65368.1 39S ribosomal protein L53, mitochondrial [Trichinella pseudospiralis]KRY86204.1 39S ribosomal protein L53, mitochondrial [Trichinella pseudospiralis]KRZ20035.1 39S ribosomal protein L53, mitochondrial [Trichinella pseudospiralis]KRZ38635.1 39S ribosomal protein L53, mitochondrial [Trichinella pseudospiralis]
MPLLWQRIRSGVRWHPNEQAAKAAAAMTLKSVKSICVRFDPFSAGNRSIREFLNVAMSDRCIQTNMNCRVTTEIKNDRCKPTLEVQFENGLNLVCDSFNMSLVDLLRVFKKYSTSVQMQSKK